MTIYNISSKATRPFVTKFPIDPPGGEGTEKRMAAMPMFGYCSNDDLGLTLLYFTARSNVAKC